jgi:hypothetical protein
MRGGKRPKKFVLWRQEVPLIYPSHRPKKSGQLTVSAEIGERSRASLGLRQAACEKPSD